MKMNGWLKLDGMDGLYIVFDINITITINKSVIIIIVYGTLDPEADPIPEHKVRHRMRTLS